ncbi:MAG: hypothetical protein MUF18_10220 [Fimbriiglobus sp.]|jgi:hypothetical protein|nr:hypothetical protein [Fimbriiglobus sp.]
MTPHPPTPIPHPPTPQPGDPPGPITPADPPPQEPMPPTDPPRPAGTARPDTTPAEEWGERIDTGRTIARGGQQEGDVPGSEPDE